MNAIYEKLTSIMRAVFDDDSLRATEELTAADVEGWDSLAHIRLLTQVEREFGIRFSAGEAQSFKRVGDLVTCIERKTTAR